MIRGYSNTCFSVHLSCHAVSHTLCCDFSTINITHNLLCTQHDIITTAWAVFTSGLQTEPKVVWREKKMTSIGWMSIILSQNIDSIAQICDFKCQLLFFLFVSVFVLAAGWMFACIADYIEHEKPSGLRRSSHVSVISTDAFKSSRLRLCSVCKAQCLHSAVMTFQRPPKRGWSENNGQLPEKNPFVLFL